MSTPERLLKATEAAELCSVHRATIWRYANRGLLPAQRLPTGERRYRRVDVVALLQTADAR